MEGKGWECTGATLQSIHDNLINYAKENEKSEDAKVKAENAEKFLNGLKTLAKKADAKDVDPFAQYAYNKFKEEAEEAITSAYVGKTDDKGNTTGYRLFGNGATSMGNDGKKSGAIKHLFNSFESSSSRGAGDRFEKQLEFILKVLDESIRKSETLLKSNNEFISANTGSRNTNILGNKVKDDIKNIEEDVLETLNRDITGKTDVHVTSENISFGIENQPEIYGAMVEAVEAVKEVLYNSRLSLKNYANGPKITLGTTSSTVWKDKKKKTTRDTDKESANIKNYNIGKIATAMRYFDEKGTNKVLESGLYMSFTYRAAQLADGEEIGNNPNVDSKDTIGTHLAHLRIAYEYAGYGQKEGGEYAQVEYLIVNTPKQITVLCINYNLVNVIENSTSAWNEDRIELNLNKMLNTNLW